MHGTGPPSLLRFVWQSLTSLILAANTRECTLSGASIEEGMGGPIGGNCHRQHSSKLDKRRQASPPLQEGDRRE
ncbi:hypothetical protein LOAG_03137 [Loa loa]|nr:hypothetical protein LOAG_03137 [Loa loa]EFO25342.2 hypothetical protein LOAG_03137 [Loa loa]